MTHSLRLQVGGSHGGRSIRSHGTHSQGAEREECWGTAHFLLFVQSKAPVQGMVPPTFGEGLLNFISSIWKVPHRHTQMWGEDEVLNKWIFLT